MALLLIGGNIRVGNYVQPSCPPDTNADVTEGVVCTAIGWGLTQRTGGELLLKQVDLAIVGRSKCNELPEYKNQISDNMLCAGGGMENATAPVGSLSVSVSILHAASFRCILFRAILEDL